MSPKYLEKGRDFPVQTVLLPLLTAGRGMRQFNTLPIQGALSSPAVRLCLAAAFRPASSTTGAFRFYHDHDK